MDRIECMVARIQWRMGKSKYVDYACGRCERMFKLKDMNLIHSEGSWDKAKSRLGYWLCKDCVKDMVARIKASGRRRMLVLDRELLRNWVQGVETSREHHGKWSGHEMMVQLRRHL